jgi:hypothetical protein
MQPFIRVRPTKGQVRLSLGMLEDLSEPWQDKARRLQARRWRHVGRPYVFRSRTTARHTFYQK